MKLKIVISAILLILSTTSVFAQYSSGVEFMVDETDEFTGDVKVITAPEKVILEEEGKTTLQNHRASAGYVGNVDSGDGAQTIIYLITTSESEAFQDRGKAYFLIEGERFEAQAMVDSRESLKNKKMKEVISIHLKDPLMLANMVSANSIRMKLNGYVFDLTGIDQKLSAAIEKANIGT